MLINEYCIVTTKKGNRKARVTIHPSLLGDTKANYKQKDSKSLTGPSKKESDWQPIHQEVLQKSIKIPKNPFAQNLKPPRCKGRRQAKFENTMKLRNPRSIASLLSPCCSCYYCLREVRALELFPPIHECRRV